MIFQRFFLRKTDKKLLKFVIFREKKLYFPRFSAISPLQNPIIFAKPRPFFPFHLSPSFLYFFCIWHASVRLLDKVSIFCQVHPTFASLKHSSLCGNCALPKISSLRISVERTCKSLPISLLIFIVICLIYCTFLQKLNNLNIVVIEC